MIIVFTVFILLLYHEGIDAFDASALRRKMNGQYLLSSIDTNNIPISWASKSIKMVERILLMPVALLQKNRTKLDQTESAMKYIIL